MMRRLVLFAVLMLIVAGLGLFWLRHWWMTPVSHEHSVRIEVTAGSSVAAISRQLAVSGVITQPRLWQWVVRAQGRDGDLRRGEYELTGALTPAQVLDVLVKGDVVHYSVTLPEGITAREALGLLHQQPVLLRRLESLDSAQILTMIEPFNHPEGLFFPDTYHYVRGDSDLSILRAAHQRMLHQLDAAWNARTAELPLNDRYEALIMASIVEKETGVIRERGQIAGVFARRLELGMRLQTDPTTIYGLGPEFDGNLRRKHLRDSANIYNTYRINGLPPTPIALPGRGALDAAVNPEPGETLYFVARGDGTHQFSATLAAHEQAVRRWQLKRREDYRSAPPAAAETP